MSDDLKYEIAILKTQYKNLQCDMHEIKENQRLLLEFMYKVNGGKALLFSFLAIASALGATIAHFAQTFIYGR